MKISLGKKIIKKMEKTYDLIAASWNQSRAFPKPIHLILGQKVKNNQKVLDLGCGNGLLYDVLAKKSIDYTGVDFSQRLLNFAKKRIGSQKNVSFYKANILSLPLPDNSFDWVFALAVLHHLPGSYFQKKALKEIYRVLKPKGYLAASAWNMSSLFVEKTFGKEIFQKKPKGFGKKDLLIPWREKGKVIWRYIYDFSPRELKFLLKQVGFRKIKVYLAKFSGQPTRSKKQGSNIFVLAQK